ncbi:hypothetical protein F5Y18DRAFT_138236 [Xylariaceae sp. FL1019]|nr:hypothetical protein F5Y18DRAFT_138236 [Xylariaceae sp. FL1019]
MFYDTELNSSITMLQNIYKAFTTTATKMWAYARCLPAPKQPPAQLIIRRSPAFTEVDSKQHKQLLSVPHDVPLLTIRRHHFQTNRHRTPTTHKQDAKIALPWLRVRCPEVRSRLVRSPPILFAVNRKHSYPACPPSHCTVTNRPQGWPTKRSTKHSLVDNQSIAQPFPGFG